MPQVDFHTGVSDKLGFTCRLLRKAYRQGARVAVTGRADDLARLDVALWTFEPLEFVPHLRVRSAQAGEPPGGQAVAPRLAATPIWLLDDTAASPHAEVLVNLGAEVAAGSERFARVIDVVSDDPEDVGAGRRRFADYRARGWPPTHHSHAAAGKAAS